jgi:hypothetical protein
MFQGLNNRYGMKHAALSLQPFEMQKMSAFSGDPVAVTEIS